MLKFTAPMALIAAMSFAAAGGQFADKSRPPPPGMEPLAVRDGHFTDSLGNQVRFWGLNLVSAFPPVEEAEAFADRIAALGVNLVRPHHLMRPSGDWVVKSPAKALSLYRDNSRDPDEEAWKRFDALNAALRAKGIRLALSLHFSRRFLPGDADILDPGTDDARQWAAAVAELNARPWQKSIDPVKMLPAIDRRALALQKEFASRLLNHRNPFTGLTYAEDPQVLTIEVVNEFSCAYTLVCGNDFPEYFERGLQKRWEDFARENGEIAPGPFRKASTPALRRLRSRFYLSLDRDYFMAMLETVRGSGCKAPVAYSNLWRGEDQLAMGAELGGYVEEHAYVDPRVANAPGDWMDTVLVRSRVAGLPFVLGEFGDAEGDRNVREQGFARTELMVAAAVYGAYHAIDGIVWFAYNHGDRDLAQGGAGAVEGRSPNLGCMACDGMLLDHMFPCSEIYRRGLVREANNIVDVVAKVPADALDYGALMRGTAPPAPPGALSLATVRKRFADKAGAYAGKPAWPDANGATHGLFVSDTGEIVRDTANRRLSLVTPFAEAFSGECQGENSRKFRHLDASLFTGGAAMDSGLFFATVAVVSLDGLPIGDSRRIIVSRTGIDKGHGETCALPKVTLRGLGDGDWRLRVKRPEFAAEVLEKLAGDATLPVGRQPDGALALPADIWTQAELVR